MGKSKNKFKLRHSNHKREIKTKMGGLGHHYGGDTGCGYKNFSVILIEKIQKYGLLSREEVYWQNQLRVYLKMGLRDTALQEKRFAIRNSAWPIM